MRYPFYLNSPNSLYKLERQILNTFKIIPDQFGGYTIMNILSKRTDMNMVYNSI